MIEATRDDDGDANYAVALMLAQITFWLSPSERTHEARTHHEHGGRRWLVRSDDGWQAELGMSERAARRCRLRLVALGLIECKTLVDEGVRCTHMGWPEQPSTIRPETADEPSTIRPERSAHLTDQAESRARASSSSLREVERSAAAPRRGSYSSEFEAFWNVCLNRRDKAEAYKSWLKLTSNEGVSNDLLIAAMKRDVEDWRRKGKAVDVTPYPSTWLNKRRWEDETAPAPAATTTVFRPFKPVYVSNG